MVFDDFTDIFGGGVVGDLPPINGSQPFDAFCDAVALDVKMGGEKMRPGADKPKLRAAYDFEAIAVRCRAFTTRHAA